MKVLLVHNYYQQPGGEDQVVADEAALLQAHGCEVVRYERHNDEVRESGKLQTALGTIWNRRSYREVRELIERERPNVMHCHNLFPLISPAAWKAAKDEGVPVVQTLHNFRWLCAGGAFLREGSPCEACLGKLPLPAIRHGCYRGSRAGAAVVAAMQVYHRLRQSFAWVDRFIALSNFSRSKFVAGGLPAERIVVKPNFLLTDAVPGKGGGGYALYVGRLSEEKGVATLLDAWKKVQSRLTLRIIGDGPLAPQVKAAAALDARIEWLGRQSQADVYSQMQSARMLILPSTCYENFPKTLVEAVAHGLPVVASDHGSLAELVAESETGYRFEAGNPEHLAAIVDRFPTGETEITRLRANARRRFEERFTADRNFEDLLAIYREAGVEGAAIMGRGARSIPHRAERSQERWEHVGGTP